MGKKKRESLHNSLCVDANPLVVLQSKAIRTNHLGVTIHIVVTSFGQLNYLYILNKYKEEKNNPLQVIFN